MAEEDDLKLDVGAIADKAEELKQVDELSFNPDAFEDIKREFKTFLDEIVGNQNLRAFKEQYQAKYHVLESSYHKEQKTLKQCKTKIAEIWDKAQSVRSAVRMAMQEVDKIAESKKSVDDEQARAASRKVDEQDKMKKIEALKQQIAEMKRKNDEAHELEEETILKQKNKEWEDLMKRKEEQDEKLQAHRTHQTKLFKQQQQSQSYIDNQISQLEKLNAQIIKAKDDQGKANDEKRKLDDKTQSLQKEKEDATDAIENLEQTKIQRNKELEQCQEKFESTTDQNNKTKGNVRAQKAELAKNQQSLVKQEKDLSRHQAQLYEHKANQDAQMTDLRAAEKEFRKLSKQQLLIQKKANVARQRCDDFSHKREMKNKEMQEKIAMQDDMQRRVEEKKKEISAKIHERKLLNGDLVTQEEAERKARDEVQMYQQQLTKIRFKKQSYAIGMQKLSQENIKLEKDKEIYAEQATAANAKYYQCLEQVKLKNNLIGKLQKKNLEAEAKLKLQFNLYEQVRSDRNLYSKNLLEAYSQIAELKTNFKRMTGHIGQLKEETILKDTKKQHEDAKRSLYVEENARLEKSILQIKAQIGSSEEMIKTQENDIARLKYVISEAEAEKAKQKKDYEMVMNERDILSTQLIKRDEELHLLYEKIKIQKSTLKKGEIYYQQKMEDIWNLKNQIKECKRQLIDAQKETQCIPDLKREIYLLEQELLEQKQKAKYLSDELEKPLNVHRWRKLESTDIETYELIQKIQSLQKRLIAKTEEVSEKDVLIQEKEKLYIELKNILAKQSGPDVTEKLSLYENNLKERRRQLKEMCAELKNYQAQVHAYKFEIDRINGKIKQTKDVYFQMRQHQLGAVQEVDEEGYGDQQQQMQGIPQGYGGQWAGGQQQQQHFLQQQAQDQQIAMQQQQMQQQQMAQQQQEQEQQQQPVQSPQQQQPSQPQTQDGQGTNIAQGEPDPTAPADQPMDGDEEF